MAIVTIKATVQKPRRDGRYIVYFRFTKDRKISYKTGKMVDKYGINKVKDITDPIVSRWCKMKVDEFYCRLNAINYEHWPLSRIITYVDGFNELLSFSKFCLDYIEQMKDKDRARTAKNYHAALMHIQNFAATDDLQFSEMTRGFMMEWIETLKETARVKEKYPTCLRYVYMLACKKYNDEKAGVQRINEKVWNDIQIPRSDTAEKRAAAPDDLILPFKYLEASDFHEGYAYVEPFGGDFIINMKGKK